MTHSELYTEGRLVTYNTDDVVSKTKAEKFLKRKADEYWMDYWERQTWPWSKQIINYNKLFFCSTLFVRNDNLEIAVPRERILARIKIKNPQELILLSK